MGVRGLTTYIAKRSDRYLEPYELHNSYLVIDGNSLASQLYNLKSKCNCSFGGDYDIYANCVSKFFSSLKKCDISPLVLLDGGYEPRKWSTVKSRLRNKIFNARHVTPVTQSRIKFFPLMMKEVFKDILKELGVAFVQCVYEADEEVACVARELGCPVLSYDSDFYVYDVLYIPFNTFCFEPTKYKSHDCDSVSYFISCKIYKVDKFVNSFGGLQKSLLPLMATLLGNDYIKRKVFSNFLSQIKRPKSRTMNETQRNIAGLLQWLRKETLETAICKILSHLKKCDRSYVAEQIKRIIAGYVRCSSNLLPLLRVTRTDSVSHSEDIYNMNVFPSLNEDIDSNGHCGKSFHNDGHTFEERQKGERFGLGEVSEEKKEEYSLEGIEELGRRESKEDEYIVKDSDELREEETSEDKCNGEDTEELQEMEKEEEEEEEEAECSDVSSNESDEHLIENTPADVAAVFPHWFLKSFQEGDFPSYFIDMLTYQTYFISPQVDDYSLLHSHAISFPIVRVIFGLLTANQGAEDVCLTYYARNNHSQAEKMTLTPLYNTSTVVFPKLDHLQDLPLIERESLLFETVDFDSEDRLAFDGFPSNWKLFLLAMVYWARHSRDPAINNCHVEAILFSLLALNVIDGLAGYYRSKKAFMKRKGNILKTRDTKISKTSHVSQEKKKSSIKFEPSSSVDKDCKLSRNNHVLNQNLRDTLSSVSIEDCLILVETMLPFHNIDEKLKSSAKLYSVIAVHAFAQFQSCLFHIIQLNALLGFPLPHCQVAHFYSGTLIYNAFINFKKRSDVLAYVVQLMNKAPSVSTLYRKLHESVMYLLPNISSLNKSKTKHRKGKLNHEVVMKGEEVAVNDNDMHPEEMCFKDINNKFSVLSLHNVT